MIETPEQATEQPTAVLTARLMRETLLPAVRDAAAAVSPRNRLPVLSNILLRSDGDMLRISGTDLEMWVTASVVPASTTEGAITVGARAFLDVLKGLPKDAIIELSQVGTTLTWRTDTMSGALPGIDAAEFPVEIAPPSGDVRLMSDALARGIGQVGMAASKDNARPILTAILFQPVGHELILAAADNYRIAEQHIELLDAYDGAGAFPIVATGLAKLAKMLPVTARAREAVSVTFERNRATFSWGAGAGRFVQIHTIDGQYPNYQQVIPVNFDVTVTGINKLALVAAIKGAAQVAKQFADVVEFTIDANGITVEAHGEFGDERHSFSTTVAADALIEGSGRWAAKASQMADVAVAPGDLLKWQLQGPLAPSRLTVLNSSAPWGERLWQYVVMPVRAGA